MFIGIAPVQMFGLVGTPQEKSQDALLFRPAKKKNARKKAAEVWGSATSRNWPPLFVVSAASGELAVAGRRNPT